HFACFGRSCVGNRHRAHAGNHERNRIYRARKVMIEYAPIRAPRGAAISCKGWHQEAAMRMLMNNLDEDVAENPRQLIVYGGSGRAARSWDAFHAIIHALKNLADDETLLVQSGKPVGVFRTFSHSPRVLIANANLVPHWATRDEFNRLEALQLTMYG